MVQKGEAVSGRDRGAISVMKRRQYLGRCRDKGEEGFDRWVGWGVLTANLDTIAQTMAAR
ncbi:MAG: hypothetical protein M3317_14620 [Actinomycetota bacterium]|nr:hypothetical protein [Actinomycetota bacterium]